jgi:hypothetical protein
MTHAPIPPDIEKRLRRLIKHLEKDADEAKDGIMRDRKEIAWARKRIKEGFFRSAKTAIVKSVVPKRARDAAAGAALYGRSVGSPTASDAVRARMRDKAKKWASGDRKEPDADGQWSGNNSTHKPIKESMEQDLLIEDKTLYRMSSHDIQTLLDRFVARRKAAKESKGLPSEQKRAIVKDYSYRIKKLRVYRERARAREQAHGAIGTRKFRPPQIKSRKPTHEAVDHELEQLYELVERFQISGTPEQHPEVVKHRQRIAALEKWKRANNKSGMGKISAWVMGRHGDTRSDHEAADDEIKKSHEVIRHHEGEHNKKIDDRIAAAERYKRIIGRHRVEPPTTTECRSLSEFMTEAEDHLEEGVARKLSRWWNKDLNKARVIDKLKKAPLSSVRSHDRAWDLRYGDDDSRGPLGNIHKALGNHLTPSARKKEIRVRQERERDERERAKHENDARERVALNFAARQQKTKQQRATRKRAARADD